MVETSNQTNKAKALIKELLVLHAGGAALVGVLSLIGGAGSYMDEVVKSAFSLRSLAIYSVYLIAYAALLEAGLRLTQAALSRHGEHWASLVIPAILYAALHLRHSLAGALYAFALGLFVAWRASRVGRWWWFVLWHIQWDLTALVATLLVLNGPR